MRPVDNITELDADAKFLSDIWPAGPGKAFYETVQLDLFYKFRQTGPFRSEKGDLAFCKIPVFAVTGLVSFFDLFICKISFRQHASEQMEVFPIQQKPSISVK
jgi:hypothetical protein